MDPKLKDINNFIQQSIVAQSYDRIKKKKKKVDKYNSYQSIVSLNSTKRSGLSKFSPNKQVS